MPRVLGFGSAALDFRITTADLGLDYRDKLLARRGDVLGGGATANCLVQVARLGGAAEWLGKLGSDWIGDQIVANLADEGVHCGAAIRDPAHCSPFNVAVYAETRRVGGFLLPNSLESMTAEDAYLLAERTERGDWVIVEVGEMALDVVFAFCQAARLRGGRIMVDVDLDPVSQCVGTTESAHDIFRSAEVIVPNHVAMGSIYPNLNARDLAHLIAFDYETTAVVTAGPHGAYWSLPGGPVRQSEALDIEVVDTVGAGDAFHGGLLSALASGEELEDAVALATRCGAAACLGFGARTSMMRA